MAELRETIRKNLVFYLKEKNISQKFLAEELGVSASAVTRWIKGDNAPDIELVSLIPNILGISISDLLGTEQTINSTPTYTPVEQTLIQNYRSVNDAGKERIITYAEDISASDRYKANIAKSVKVAARNGKSEIHLTDEQKKITANQIKNLPKSNVDDLF